MKKLGYEGIGEVVVTVGMTKEVEKGMPVCLEDSGMVRPCAGGEVFCGIAHSRRGEYGGMQVKGFSALPFSGALSVGWAMLAADGEGGVCQAENGLKVLVMEVDEDACEAVICL